MFPVASLVARIVVDKSYHTVGAQRFPKLRLGFGGYRFAELRGGAPRFNSRSFEATIAVDQSEHTTGAQ